MLPLVLASGSPRRWSILRERGIPVVRVVPRVEEVWPGGPPEDAVRHLARTKAWEVARRVPAGRLVVAADTAVVDGERILGKPGDAGEALAMLTSLAGKTHTVWTGVAVLRAPGGVCRTAAVCTRVRMKAWSTPRLARYLATGEPWDKAGAYAVQGWGAALVEHIEGDFLAVVGLPLGRLAELCEEFGVDLLRESTCG